MNVGAAVIGLGFLVIAIFDGVGVKLHINKKYRDHVGVRLWQKKRVCIDILVSIGAWILFFVQTKSDVLYIVGVVVLLLGLLFLYMLDAKMKSK